MEAGWARRRRRLDAQHESPTLPHTVRQGDTRLHRLYVKAFDVAWRCVAGCTERSWVQQKDRHYADFTPLLDRAGFFVRRPAWRCPVPGSRCASPLASRPICALIPTLIPAKRMRNEIRTPLHR